MKTTEPQKADSGELKKAEISRIILQVVSDLLPDFEFRSFNKSQYTFERLRKTDRLTIFELLHLGFSSKSQSFVCSVASRTNPTYVDRNDYNNGLLNPHTDLKALRHQTGILSLREGSYFCHNLKAETICEALKEVCRDFKEFGLPFLDKQFQRLETSEIIAVGLDYIANLNLDKLELQSEIQSELKNGNWLIFNLKHDIYLDLKSRLQNLSGQSREDRKKLPGTALEFLEIYWTN